MPFAKLGSGVRLHYLERGAGAPIVFIAGHVSALSWGHQLAALGDNFRCIAVDQRGHGDSDKPDSGYSYPEFADDLHAFLDALDLAGAVIVGHSMAASVAVQWALKHTPSSRTAALVLVGAGLPRLTHTTTHPFGLPAAAAEQVLADARTAFPETLAAAWQNLFHRADMETTRTWMISDALRMPVYAAADAFEAEITADYSEQLPSLSTPTAMFHGRHDAICDPRWAALAADWIPNCELTWFENSGHCPHLEEPEAFNDALRSFVAGLGQGS